VLSALGTVNDIYILMLTITNMDGVDKMKTRMIEIQGTGDQAPYGIGEIIDRIPASYTRKIQSIVDQWYNRPAVICCDCGREINHSFDPCMCSK